MDSCSHRYCTVQTQNNASNHTHTQLTETDEYYFFEFDVRFAELTVNSLFALQNIRLIDNKTLASRQSMSNVNEFINNYHLMWSYVARRLYQYWRVRRNRLSVTALVAVDLLQTVIFGWICLEKFLWPEKGRERTTQNSGKSMPLDFPLRLAETGKLIQFIGFDDAFIIHPQHTRGAAQFIVIFVLRRWWHHLRVNLIHLHTKAYAIQWPHSGFSPYAYHTPSLAAICHRRFIASNIYQLINRTCCCSNGLGSCSIDPMRIHNAKHFNTFLMRHECLRILCGRSVSSGKRQMSSCETVSVKWFGSSTIMMMRTMTEGSFPEKWITMRRMLKKLDYHWIADIIIATTAFITHWINTCHRSIVVAVRPQCDTHETFELNSPKIFILFIFIMIIWSTPFIHTFSDTQPQPRATAAAAAAVKFLFHSKCGCCSSFNFLETNGNGSVLSGLWRYGRVVVHWLNV